jgi:hypothetical protein
MKHHTIRLSLAVALALGAVGSPALADDGIIAPFDPAAAIDPATSGDAPGISGVVEPPSGPILIDPGPYVPAPAVQLFATCAVARRGTTTVWFGYQNIWTERVVSPVGPGNDVLIDSLSIGNLGQVDQFQPGRVDRAFAVTLRSGQVATWAADVADLNNLSPTIDPPTRVVASSSATTPACAVGTPIHSATPQSPAGLAEMNVTLGGGDRQRKGMLTRSTVRFDVSGVISACSAGGVPLAPKVLFGYMGPADQLGTLVLKSSGADYAPLAPRQIAQTTVLGGTTVRWSTVAERSIADPQQLFTYGATPAQATYWPSARGLTSQRVIADVTARCRFGGRIVSSSTVYWADGIGRGYTFATVTDAATQTTREATVCNIDDLAPLSPALGCDVPFVGVGPGGVKLR